MKKIKQRVLGLILVVVLAVVLLLNRTAIAEVMRSWTKPALPKTVSYQNIVEQKKDVVPTEPITSPKKQIPTLSSTTSPTSSASLSSLPLEFNLSVPFTSQAPGGNWDIEAKESCEEASLLMVKSFYEGATNEVIPSDVAKSEMLKIIAFEMQTFGYFEDTTADQTATIAEQFLGYPSSDVIENPTVDQIKQALVNGNPVIVPAAGRMLNNPYFQNPGPIYHMFVVRGFTKDNQFIVNDPGTKRGQSYIYPIETVMNAIHDWNNGGEMTAGKKVVLIIYPNK